MGLLFRSTLRHLRQHLVQTTLTLAVTALAAGLVFSLFFFASGFQASMRKYALENVGAYHYCYSASAGTPAVSMLFCLAEAFQEDPWFSHVDLQEEEDRVNLYLTAAFPGPFTSMTMDKKYAQSWQQFRSRFPSPLVMEYRHNHQLLASYGDLNRDNGLYSILLVFFLVTALTAALSGLTLAAVFGVSASQRKKEFALLMSTGADSRQIRNIVLGESLFYAGTGLPAGYLLGMLFFLAGRGPFDALLQPPDNFPPVKLVFSVPYSGLAAVCAGCILLVSGLIPAKKAASAAPVALLRRTEETVLPPKKRQRNTAQKVLERLGPEAWLAFKSIQRFRRRFRPVILALSAAYASCFVMAGFRTFATEVMEMARNGQDYNLSVELYSSSLEELDRLSAELVRSSGGGLCPMRMARFELLEPWPLSQEALELDFPRSQGRRPEVQIVSPEEKTWEDICSQNGISSGPLEGMGGIFLDRTGPWFHDGILFQSRLFFLEKGDTVALYAGSGGETAGQERGAAAELTVLGVLEDVPLYLGGEPASRLTLLVSPDNFLQLEALCQASGQEPGLHHITLRGMCRDASETEEICRRLLENQEEVQGFVSNLARSLQRDRDARDGLQYLCASFILLMTLVGTCGNFTVSWSADAARRKEFAALSSAGMTPEELRKMKIWEILFQTGCSFLAGLPAGVLCWNAVFQLYSIEYRIPWRFPWQGILMGTALLWVSALATYLALKLLGQSTVAEMLSLEEE